MQVLETHHAYLSNFEVLQHLTAEVNEQQRAINAFKKAHPAPKFRHQHTEPEPGKPHFDYQQALSKIVPDNVRTLQVEVSRMPMWLGLDTFIRGASFDHLSLENHPMCQPTLLSVVHGRRWNI